MSDFKCPEMAKVTRVAAIDPGTKGAVMVLEEGRLTHFRDLPLIKMGKRNLVDFATLLELVDEYDPHVLVVEKVDSSSQMGHINSFSFGSSFAFALAVGPAAGIPTFVMNPSEWKAYHGLQGKQKTASTKKARAVFADQSDYVSLYFKNAKADCDKAEAALMAKYFWDIKRFTRSIEEALW